MSSVEQKIREVLENVAIEYGEYPSPKTINVDQATQSILQIIESDVVPEPVVAVGHDEDYDPTDGKKRAVKDYALGWNDCIAEQRANLREEK